MACCALAACAVSPEGVVRYQVRGDAIVEPLTAVAGDPARGRDVVAGRDANCLLCHSLPESGERFMGNLAPPLSRVGSRLSEGQLRLRIVDSSQVNREAVMPSYYRVEGFDIVAAPYRGKPILTSQQIEDVVAYLRSLR